MFPNYLSDLFQTNDCQRVTQYQFLSWKSGVVPDSAIALMSLVDASLANNSQHSSPIVVHCSGGGDRSSVFVAFASLVQQIKCEERVDVFQTARYTRSQRQCMLQTIVSVDPIERLFPTAIVDTVSHFRHSSTFYTEVS